MRRSQANRPVPQLRRNVAILGTAAIAIALSVLGFANVALAAFPGANGRIVFVHTTQGNDDIYTINPDGTGLAQLTSDPADDSAPAWSADGRKIAFASERDGNYEIYTMNADGSDLLQLTDTLAVANDNPAWSPDGSKLVFTRTGGTTSYMYTMNPDGTDEMLLATDGAEMSWSPDGTEIIFTSNRDGDNEIYKMNADGSGVPVNLTNNSEPDQSPNWSPDGSKITFDRVVADSHIYTMNADGSDQTMVPTGRSESGEPAWSPDGRQIAFRDAIYQEIYVVNVDGSDPRQVTDDPTAEGQRRPDWQPLTEPDMLTLSPQTATNRVDEQHCLTATVTAGGQPVSGVVVQFSVSGSNTLIGSATTDSNGEAQFCYTAILPGNDTIGAYADSDGDSVQDVAEPAGTATKAWAAPLSTRRCKITGGGRIVADNGDRAAFGGSAHASNGALSPPGGSETYLDHGPVQSTFVKGSAIKSVTCSEDRITGAIFASGRADAQHVQIRIDVHDLGEPGNDDTYRIRASNGYDSGEHTLQSGDIQIHR